VNDLFCHCGKGPFLNAQRLGAHRTCHETVVCETCGQKVGRQGIGVHRKMHRLAGEEQVAVVRVERIIRTLRDLTPPQMAPGALERAAQLLDQHPEHRGLFIVAGATYGPHLTSRQNVGGLVAKAQEPCVVVDLDLLPTPARPVAAPAKGWI
jgi:hypothetical protein